MEDLDLEVAGNIMHAFSYFDNEDVHMSSDTVTGSILIQACVAPYVAEMSQIDDT